MSFSKEQITAELQRRGVQVPSFSKKEIAAELERRGVKIPESHGEESSLGRSLAKGARNVAAGLGDIADIVWKPAAEIVNVGARMIGSDARSPSSLANTITENIDNATEGYTAPHTNTEKIEESIQRALTGLPVGGAAASGIKGVGNLAKGAKSFLQTSSEINPVNIVSTAGASGAAQHMLNQDPNDAMGAFGASLVGGIAPQFGRGLTKAGRQLASERLGKNIGNKIGFSSQALEDFEKSGVTPLLSDVSTSQPLKMATNSLSKVPYAGKPIKEAQSKQYKQILERLGQDEFGNIPLTRSEAGDLTKQGAKGYQKVQNQQHSNMFSQVERDLEKIDDLTISPTHFHQTYDELTKNLKTPTQWKRFEKSTIGKKISEIHDAILGGRGFTYHEGKEILDEINDAITTHGTIGKVSQGKLKTLAAAIGKDIDDSLEPKFKKLGEESYNNWKKARSIYREYAQNDIPRLNKIYKKDERADIFMDLVNDMKKGSEKAKIAMQGLTEHEAADLMHVVNHKLGLTKNGFSPNVWASNFKSLEPEAQKLILAPLGKDNTKKALALTDAMDRMKETIAQANSSQTAYHNMMGALAVYAGHAAISLGGGNFMPAAKLASGLLAGRLGSNLLTNKKVINWLGDSMRAKDMKTFQRRLEVASQSKGMPQGFTHATNEMLRMMKEDPRNEDQKKNKFFKGGIIRQKFADGGEVVTPEEADDLEKLYPGITKGIEDYGKFLTRGGQGYSSDYIKAIKDEVKKESDNDAYLRYQLQNKDWNFLNNLNLLDYNSAAGGARKYKSGIGQDYDTALKDFNQNLLTSEDSRIKNNAGVKYLRQLYAKVQDPNASWNDIDKAKQAQSMIEQGYTYRGNQRGTDSWLKDDTNILDAIRSLPVVGDIAKAVGVDRMVANMDQIMKSENIGEGLKNTLNFATDAASTIGSAVTNPGQFAIEAATNLATDKLLPKPSDDSETNSEGYEQEYGEYDSSPHIQSMMNPTAPQRQYIGQANQPYLQQQQAVARPSGGEAGENYGYTSSEQRAAQHKAYAQNHPSEAGTPQPQASPPPPATGTTAPPAISNQIKY